MRSADTAPRLFLGPTIRARRWELGLTQLALAKRLGVHDSIVTHWEHDRRPVPVFRLPALAEALLIAESDLVRHGQHTSCFYCTHAAGGQCWRHGGAVPMPQPEPAPPVPPRVPLWQAWGIDPTWVGFAAATPEPGPVQRVGTCLDGDHCPRYHCRACDQHWLYERRHVCKATAGALA